MKKILLILALTSCMKYKIYTGYPAPELIERKVFKGYSKADVIASSGEPSVISDDGNAFYYVRINGDEGNFTRFKPRDKVITSVIFEGDKVVEIKTEKLQINKVSQG